MLFSPIANADSKSMALAASGKGVHHITTLEKADPDFMVEREDVVSDEGRFDL